MYLGTKRLRNRHMATRPKLTYNNACAWVQVAHVVVKNVVVRSIMVPDAAGLEEPAARGEARLALVDGDGVRGEKVGDDKGALRVHLIVRVNRGDKAEGLESEEFSRVSGRP